MPDTRPIIALAGPTGAGKTAAALTLARAFNGWVINADSRQIYRDFPLITAQPSPEERQVCPHLLYGTLQTHEACSAGRWEAAAAEAIRQCRDAGALPILVGGTGLYLRALLDGMVEIPPVPEAVRDALEQEYDTFGGDALYARLQSADPAYALRVHPRNRQRLIRALAVHAATGHSFSWWHAQTPPPPYPHVIRLGVALPLEYLTPRLFARIHAMLDAGAMDEARTAMDICPDPAAPGWSGIGCAELHEHLTGSLSLDETIELWFKNTRAYAKRQLTWFRADSRIRWFAPADETIVSYVEGVGGTAITAKQI